MNIAELGWNDRLEEIFAPAGERGLIPGRIISASQGLYDVYTAAGRVLAAVTGRFRHETAGASDYPVPGDWVALRREGDICMVEEVLPRRTVFARKAAGRRADDQVIASNLDLLCVVASLDGGRGFTLRGIERYLVLARQGGVSPLVILNKSDLCPDVAGAVMSAETSSAGAPVLALSARTGDGLEDLRRYLGPGITVAFVGPSGAGKSSLVNALSDSDRLATGEVRQGDLRGRHTTTRGEMFPLPGGALVIDTPGLREIALCGTGDGIDASFPEIADAAVMCRFKDCTHTGEPGCAVDESLRKGLIDHGRFRNYMDMKRELAYLDGREDPEERRKRKQEEKKLSRVIRDYNRGR